MSVKTIEHAPNPEPVRISGGCCRGKTRADTAPAQESRATAPGAQHGDQSVGCGCGKS